MKMNACQNTKCPGRHDCLHGRPHERHDFCGHALAGHCPVCLPAKKRGRPRKPRPVCVKCGGEITGKTIHLDLEKNGKIFHSIGPLDEECASILNSYAGHLFSEENFQ